MTLPIILTATPCAFGLLALVLKDYRLRRSVVTIAALIQAGLAVLLAVQVWASLPLRISIEIPYLDQFILGGELVLAAYFAVRAVRSRRLLPLLLTFVQVAVAIAGGHWTGGIEAQTTILIDQMSILMVLVIGIVGGLIVIYATGYMSTFQREHPEVRDRRQTFSFVFLVFLGAMYGLVLANDLRIMLFFWELTTWASFVLIGYNEDEQSKKSAFLALNMNLVGGIAFALGVIVLAATAGTVEMDRLGAAGPLVVAIPVACIALAGLVKSAQLPFTPWLLGAMVAPTPVSALLHSSTMVKAGVFLLIRLAPVMSGTTVGILVAFVGILTFIVGAFIAVSRRNAKRILALSTVSNLGLIVTCAGIGTPQLIWAAFFLIVFHAIAKALLFLAVGTTSVGTGSLDIEDMGGLITSMPRVAMLLLVGIAVMFVAPFGMLISKWTAMEAFINMNNLVAPLMIVMLAFGSATTVLFWTKWMGLVIRLPDPGARRGLLEEHTSGAELLSEGFLAGLAILACVAFPIISHYVVEPFLLAEYGKPFSLDAGNAVVTVLMVIMTVIVPWLLITITRRSTKVLSGAYMSGRPTATGLVFKGTAGVDKSVDLRSYYLAKYFDERWLLRGGILVSILLTITMFGTVLL
ncbi:MAG TPA: proton-conducting transporter membrane subunit [Rectinemataceae bacterium]|nr:proton-conducting transporter membrane subunit [Rectinemataceae bacterium]